MKSTLLLAVTTLILTLALMLSFTVVQQNSFVFRSRAQVASINRSNSFVFLVPACGKAGPEGVSLRLNVVALTDAGLGKGNVECKVVAPYTYRLSIRAIQGITDSYGKAFFDIEAENPGVYAVQVVCDDIVINEEQKVCFE
jgi:hypothetical protein